MAPLSLQPEAFGAAQGGVPRPEAVVLFVGDDMGIGDIAGHGLHSAARTPRIDEMAKRGETLPTPPPHSTRWAGGES